MRNKYPGVCYYCKSAVAKGAGHFERYQGGWRTIHADCVFKQRKEKEVASIEQQKIEELLA